MIPILRLPLIALALASAAVAQQPPAVPGDVVVNMRDVDIAVMAEQVSRLTGRTLILDPQVRGQVTVTSAEPLGVSGVWELFQAVLHVHGYAAVRSGRVWRVVPEADAVRTAAGPVASGQVVTRLIRLRNLAPDTAARIFRPLVAQFGSLEPLTSPNAIVVTDYADNVARIERLAAALDGGGGGSFESIPLRLAGAKQVGEAIRALYGEGDGAPKVAVDERSNVVLVRGDAHAIAEARRIAAQLDKPGGAGPTTRVFRLKNADSESVTDVLRGLMGGQDQSANPVARSLAAKAPPSGNALIPPGAIAGANTPAGNPLQPSSVTGDNMLPTGGLSMGSPAAADDSAPAPSTGFSTPDLAVQSAPELNAIVVRGTPAAIAQVQSLVDQLDVRRPQVMIEAAIVEITGDNAEALGVQFGLGKGLPDINGAVSSFTNIGTGLQSVLSALNVPLATAASATGFTGAVASHDDFQLLVQALGSSTKANRLSTPSITTLDNQPAEIVVGQNVPFRTGSYTTLASGTTTPFVTIERQDVGLTLRIVPRVHEGDVVRLDVAQEVSSIANSVAGAADLVTNRRVIQTTVLADDGQTIVLGGLISDDRTDSNSKVPVLGDIPVVGNLFKSRQVEHAKRTLFVFLRPTILRTADQVAAAAAGKYGRLRQAEAGYGNSEMLLLDPPRARLTVEIGGIY